MKRRYQVNIVGDFIMEAESPSRAQELINAFIKAKDFSEKNFECGISLIKDPSQPTETIEDIIEKEKPKKKRVAKSETKIVKPKKAKKKSKDEVA